MDKIHLNITQFSVPELVLTVARLFSSCMVCKNQLKADELIMHQIIKVNDFNESIKPNFLIEITLGYVLPSGYSSIKQSVLAHRRLSTLNFRCLQNQQGCSFKAVPSLR